jgi:multifunctional 2-oxoglutarate metabolism enzyme
MTVAAPSTPASYFHLLRWQGLSGRHKPLIVFTPKSMLRLKAAASATAEFTTGSFEPLIGEAAGFDGSAVKRVILCTGKVYWDLAERRRAVDSADAAIVRLERLYPAPVDELRAELSRYPSTAELVWVQEEPANQGAWPWMALKLPEVLGRPLRLVAQPASSAPSVGSAKVHAASHRGVIESAIPAEG